jgi:hypothetical protein
MPSRCSGDPIHWGAPQRPTWEEYYYGAQTAFAPTMHRTASMLTPSVSYQEHRAAAQGAYRRIASMPTHSNDCGMQWKTIMVASGSGCSPAPDGTTVQRNFN